MLAPEGGAIECQQAGERAVDPYDVLAVDDVIRSGQRFLRERQRDEKLGALCSRLLLICPELPRQRGRFAVKRHARVALFVRDRAESIQAREVAAEKACRPLESRLP